MFRAINQNQFDLDLRVAAIEQTPTRRLGTLSDSYCWSQCEC